MKRVLSGIVILIGLSSVSAALADDPPYMHFYQIDPTRSTFKFRLKNHIAAVTVESDNAGGSIVIWRIYYDYVARPLTAMKKPLFNTAIPAGLDGLVEIHGGTRLEPSEEPPN